MHTSCSICTLLGRFCLALIFVLSGVGKFMDWEGTAGYMAAKGFTFIPFFLVAAALVEIIAGLMVIVGYKTRFAAFILFLFLIPTTLIFHDFWNAAPGMEKTIQMIMFMKNLSIMGGLLFVMGCGAGGCSVDRLCCGSTACTKDHPKI